MIRDRLVYYAVNDSPLHVRLALRSVRSLRRYNVGTRVEVYVFGKLPKKDKAAFQRQKVFVRELRFPDGVDPTYLKWFALRFAEAKQTLYLDVDTYFFEDVEILFRKYRGKMFSARLELGASEELGYQQLGNALIPPLINHLKLRALAKVLDFRVVPMFNTGVMMMSRAFVREIGGKTGQFVEFRRFFREKPSLQPARSDYVTEEVVASIVAGKMKGFTYSYLKKEDAPFYGEWKGKAVSSPGVVMHYYSNQAPFFFRDFEGLKAARGLGFPAPFSFEYGQP